MAIDLSTIIPSKDIKPPKVVIYGVGGIGKTTWAAAAPNPIFIFTEAGQGQLELAKFPGDTGTGLCKSFVTVLECCKALYEQDHNYGTVVLDGLDFTEALCWAYTCQQYGQPSIDTNGGEFGFGRGYLLATENGRLLLDWLDRLRDEKNMAVVCIAHADAVKFHPPESEAYDRYEFRLHKRFRETVHDWADAVLFANYETYVVKDTEGTGKHAKERARGSGMGQRKVYTEQRPAFVAKNRYSLPPELPLEWQAFQDAMSNPQPKS